MTHRDDRPLSRRAFLKGAGALTAALALESACDVPIEASSADVVGDDVGVLIDLSRCVGCRSCEEACKTVHGLSYDPRCRPIRLSADTLTFVDWQTDPTEACEPTPVKRQCMHCVHPACASACTVGALHKAASGPVVYDADKCIGCRYCQYACPFGVPTFQWQETLGLISKCDLCADRLTGGMVPACVSACPTGALKFGKRSALLAEAKGRIRANHERYVNHIYGEHEVGGTSILYLSAVPFDEIGFPTLGSQPIPQQAEFVMKQTPVIALTVATAASSLCWFCKRREENTARTQTDVEEVER